MKARELSVGGIFTGLAVVALYFASILQMAGMGLTAIAGLMPIMAITSAGWLAGVMTYIATVIITFFIVPIKSYVIIYAVVFGSYPIIKFFVDKIGNVILRWAIKIIVANAQISFLIFVYSALFLNSSLIKGLFEIGIFFVILFFNGVFIAYEIGISQFLDFYKTKIKIIK